MSPRYYPVCPQVVMTRTAMQRPVGLAVVLGHIEISMRFPFSGCFLHEDRIGWKVKLKRGGHMKVCNGDLFWGTIVTAE